MFRSTRAPRTAIVSLGRAPTIEELRSPVLLVPVVSFGLKGHGAVRTLICVMALALKAPAAPMGYALPVSKAKRSMMARSVGAPVADAQTKRGGYRAEPPQHQVVLWRCASFAPHAAGRAKIQR